jgi:hypothetical protein
MRKLSRRRMAELESLKLKTRYLGKDIQVCLRVILLCLDKVESSAVVVEELSPLCEVQNLQNRKSKRKNSDYLSVVNHEQQLSKLKEDYSKLYQEKVKVKAEYENYKYSIEGELVIFSVITLFREFRHLKLKKLILKQKSRKF